MDLFHEVNTSSVGAGMTTPIPLVHASLNHQWGAFLPASKWTYYLGAPMLTTILWCLWTFVLRLFILRRWYEKQGIQFVPNCYAVVGAEMRVTKLQQRNKSHDWLYTNKPTSLYGTVRGFRLQLYSTTAGLCDELISATGKHVDRDTPALYSFGRLSPYAMTFLPATKWRFRERKNTLMRGIKDNKRLYEIAERQAMLALKKFRIKDGSGARINVRELLNDWTSETSGENVWGKNNISRYLEVKVADGTIKSLPLMTALNQTFTELRFYASRFWNRICFPLAGLPLTKESRRLNYNIRILRAACADMMKSPEEGAVAKFVQEVNGNLGIDEEWTRDDLVTATIAGFDTIKSSLMGTLYHLLEPKNLHWRKAIMDEINALEHNPDDTFVGLMNAPVLNSFINESLRYEPPGSLINNAAVNDFELSAEGNTYQIKAGTRIVTCVHALHKNEESWGEKVGKMSPLADFDPNRFIHHGEKIIGSTFYLPFGKGLRRCPGQGAALMMVKAFIKAFLQSSYNCRITTPDNQTKDSTWFNLYSKATFDIVCDKEAITAAKDVEHVVETAT